MVTTYARFLIDTTFLLQASEAAFFRARLLVDKGGFDHTRTYGATRDLLRLRRKLGIRNALVVVGEESVAATCNVVLEDVLALLDKIGASVLRMDSSSVVDLCAQSAASARWIVSANSAMQQLVTEQLGIICPHAGGDPEVVTKEKLDDAGMRPEWVPAVLALSDGKDAPLKRGHAVRLLQVYGSLDALLADASIGPSSDWKRKLAPNADRLLHIESQLRARPLAFPAPPASPERVFIEDSEESVAAIEAYGFWSLVRMLPLPNPRVIGEARSVDGHADYRAVCSVEDWRALEEYLEKADVCAVDTETSGKDPRTATLFGVALSVNERQAFYVPVTQSDLNGLSPDEIYVRLGSVLSGRLKLVGHNLKYDFTVLQCHGIDVQGLHFDTLVAARECFGDWDFWNLSSVASKLLGASVTRYRDILKNGETFLDRPFNELVEHACCDADMALRLYAVLSKELRKRGVEEQFFEGAMRVEKLLVARQRDGVRVDVPRMRAVGELARASAEALRAAVIADAGCDFDLDSPKITAEVLGKLGLYEERSHRIGESQLEQVAAEVPLVAKIVRYRRERRRTKSIEAICNAAKDGRVYPLLSQSRVWHGAVSSSSPGLEEAFAAGAILDQDIAGLFTDVGRSLRALADASSEAALGEDLGAEKGKDGFMPEISVVGHAAQREAVLLTAVGEPDSVIARRFLIARGDARKLRGIIVSRYPALFRWLQDAKKSALANGFIDCGMTRKYLAGLHSSDVDKRNRALRLTIRWLAFQGAWWSASEREGWRERAIRDGKGG